MHLWTDEMEYLLVIAFDIRILTLEVKCRW